MLALKRVLTRLLFGPDVIERTVDGTRVVFRRDWSDSYYTDVLVKDEFIDRAPTERSIKRFASRWTRNGGRQLVADGVPFVDRHRRPPRR